MVLILSAHILLLLLFAVVTAQNNATNICGDNARFLTCGSPCVETCTYKPKMCIAMCKAGCFCEDGYIRESSKADSPCIKPIQCISPKVASQCGANEDYRTCGSACPSTCDQWKYPVSQSTGSCIAVCKSGCFCKSGFYRSKKGTCVKREECCGENEIFLDCGSACVETCNNKPQVCTEQCVSGCYCKNSDYVRQNNSTGSSCIERNQCSQ